MLKKRLLVIEDDTDIADMLHAYFDTQGYEIFNALSGEEGVGMARAKSPNLILLDVMLPDMDGFDVCKALRTTPLTKFIPIIFLTQRDRRADKVAGLELGADDYITKPFDVDELRLRVQGSLRRASREALTDTRTGLPTIAVIREIEATLATRTDWTRLDVEINGFRAFRDYYGFVAGDEVIAFIGLTLAECIAAVGTPDDFAGMVAEDRYTVVTYGDGDALLNRIMTQLQNGLPAFYSFMEREQGYLILNSGTSTEERVGLMRAVIHKSTAQSASATA
jgi:DNA-binding response OmpR family regulator